MESLHWSQFEKDLKSRPKGFHKGDAGSILIVGGDFGYWGAPHLAGVAALRVGAGLVRIATRPQPQQNDPVYPELMCHGIETTAQLEYLLAKSDVIVAGPGLGQSPWSLALWNDLMKTEKPLVFDADALNLLVNNPIQKENWILTPHPGEAARLLKTTTEKIQKDRPGAVLKLQQNFGGIAILKGAGSLIATHAGKIFICNAGNPGMATAGMGDVLSGVIGGLLAQKFSLTTAAKLGVLLHAMAGDRAAEKGERGMIASDLFPYLRELVNWE